MNEESPIPFSTQHTHGYNADSPQQVAVATAQHKKREIVEADDLAVILEMEEGRRFITRVLQLTGLNQLSDGDPVLCQRQEGARSVGIELCKILNRHSIHAYPRLLTEAAMQQEQEQRERSIALEERTAAAKAQGWLSRTLGLHR